LILLGDHVSAEEARQIGLVNAVTTQEQLVPIAFDWAARLCKNGPLAVRASKEVAYRGLDLAFREAMRLEGEFYNLRPRQLSWRPDNGWSLLEIAGHLRDNEELTLGYLRAIISSRRPLLEVVDLEGFVEEGRYRRLDLHEALYTFSELRQRLVYLLHELSEHQWRRGGQHPYRDTVSVGQIVRETRHGRMVREEIDREPVERNAGVASVACEFRRACARHPTSTSPRLCRPS